MNAKKVIAYLKNRGASTIVVTGPQRSGTRIGAKIIADELGFRYVDEDEIGISRIEEAWKLLTTETNIVLQCPALCHVANELPCDAVVFMKRDIVDIIQSQRRALWDTRLEADEKEKYGLRGDPRPISLIKYDRANMQIIEIRLSDRIATYMDFVSLSYHPLWVPKQERVGFMPRETEKK